LSTTNQAEDKLLLSRAYDAIELAGRRGIPRFLGFLNEHESAYLRANISPRTEILFFGGYPGATRLMLGAGAGTGDFPITAIEFRYRKEDELRHRDFLGALMAQGIRRETVGDILTGEGRTVVFFTDEIVPYLLANVDRIGRVGVKLGYADTDNLPKGDTAEEKDYTLSSLRLDAFVAAVCGISREKAARVIRSEQVAVDHVTVTELSAQLSEGATITVRGYGKFILASVGGLSRKGRLRVTIQHYK
jgi:RNA-binding protein YlmH